MPNPIKYSTSTQTQALKVGNFWIGTNDVPKGETSVTDYWNGITPPVGGYTIYLGRVTNGPVIYVAANDSELVDLTNRIVGTNFTSASQCLSYFATQSTSKVFNKDVEPIITNGLVFNLDATISPSNPGTGSTWYNISGVGNNGSLSSAGGSGYTFNSSSQSSISFLSSPTMSISNVGGFSTVTSYTELNNISSTSSFTFTCNFLVNSYLRQRFPAENDISDSVGLLVKGSFNPSYGIDLIFQSPTPSTSGTFSIVYLRYGIRQGSLFPNQSINAVNSLPLSLNEWYNATFTHTYTGTTNSGTHSMIFYVNGASFSTSYNTFIDFANTSEVTINSGVLGTNNIRGNITVANAMIYNRALSKSEVVQNYKAYISPRILSNSMVTDGLVLLLDARYGSSYPRSGNTWFDISGNDYRGALTNGPTFSSSDSGSIGFDGVDDYINNIGSVSDFSFIQNTGVYTIAAWVKINTLANNIIMGNNDGGSGNKGFFINCTGVQGNIGLQITYGVSGQFTLGHGVGTYFSTNTWTYITFTGNGSVSRIYKNGQPVGTTAVFGTFSTGNSSRTLAVGRANSLGSVYWSGNISNVKIYNRTLSASEVLQNYNGTKSRYGL